MDSTYYDHPRSYVKELPKKFFLKFCDFALCYGSRSKEYLQMLGMRADRLQIRCQAAPAERLLAARAKQNIADGIPEGQKYFLYVGRLSPEKRVEDLIAAFAALLPATRTGTKLVIVGGGPSEAALKNLAKETGLAEDILFLGPMKMEEIVPYYAAAFALVLPSSSEPWGLVVNEGLLFGCPAIVSDVCGCAPDLIVPDQTGLIFSSKDVEDLSAKLARMIELSPRRQKMAEECIALISNFTPKSAATQMLAGILRSQQTGAEAR